MLFETIVTLGLAHLSYIVGEVGGDCAVIDPRRDVEAYLDLARERSARITHLIETHIHADFVSGSRELAARTGATIYAGASEDYRLEHRPVNGGDTLEVGGLCLRALHTPGHTPEHVSFVVSNADEADRPFAVFTGDTLFVGEVGRPDLIGGGTEGRLARQLYRSLFEKLLPLGDEVEIYPAHGEGSPCGGNIGDRRTSTIGYERLHNAKLQAGSEDEFVQSVLSGLPPAPRYYARMKEVNAHGPEVLGGLPTVQPLPPEEFQRDCQEGRTVVLDTREIEAFGGAHVGGALNIPLREEFPVWCGWMLDCDPGQKILLVLEDESHLDEAVRQLLRVGFENICGYLQLGMRGWIEAGLPFATLPQLSVHELKARMERGETSEGGLQLLDVRREDEWDEGHLPTARHVFAAFLGERLDELDRDRPVAVYCGSGYRASIAASVLQRNGFRAVYNVPGSMKAWKAAGFETVKPGEG